MTIYHPSCDYLLLSTTLMWPSNSLMCLSTTLMCIYSTLMRLSVCHVTIYYPSCDYLLVSCDYLLLFMWLSNTPHVTIYYSSCDYLILLMWLFITPHGECFSHDWQNMVYASSIYYNIATTCFPELSMLNLTFKSLFSKSYGYVSNLYEPHRQLHHACLL